mgnify:CR=1 FL=1
METLSWNYDKVEKGKIYLSSAQKCYLMSRNIALGFIDRAIECFFPLKSARCDLAHCYYFKACLLWNENQDLAKEFYIKSIEFDILGSKRGYYKSQRFYKFVGVDIKYIDSILNRIQLQHPSKFNDPMDCPIASDSDNGIPDINLLNSLRVGCFGVVKNSMQEYYLNASKWSYYGDFHKGICIEYDFSKLEFDELTLMDKVNYVPEYDPTNGIVKGALLTKSKDYNHENEWRIIWYDRSWISKGIEEPQYINIHPSMIQKIYIGFKCPVEIKEYIMRFQQENSHIKVFQISPSKENYYKLTASILS